MNKRIEEISGVSTTPKLGFPSHPYLYVITILIQVFALHGHSNCIRHHQERDAFGRFMPDAFVLFKTIPSGEREVYNALTEMDSVKELHALYGEYDLLARINAPNSRSLTKLLMEEIRNIGGIKDTQTLIAVDI